ncbi:DUF11 domain-containing protein [Vallitalea maricola]|uniref:Uncharacterized protein n=1 Tax=Vallitalea maricola TaxID=3074433 RepID=A0ACB5UJL9_9FIRM|nr:hypothetical protein AN2V17_20590 [Vallitalea sp. AN17-2]
MAVPFGCTQQGIQIAFDPTNFYTIDLVTGSQTLVGPITPSGTYNAIGYNVLDDYIYGYNISTNRIIRLSSDATTETLAVVPNLPIIDFNTGDVNLNGYLYLFLQNTNRFYVVDLDPGRSTYLQLVDPANNFQLQTSNFGVAITTQNIADWAFNPVDGQLYAVTAVGQVIRINPITGAVTPLITAGPLTPANYGANFFDSQGNFYVINNTTGEVFRITTTATTATAILFSNASASESNDGTRCPLAQLDLMSVVKSVDLTEAVLGNRITYTIVITNNSTIISTTNVVFTDPIPNGTTYVPGSATVNGLPAVGTPATGITIGTLAPGASATVQFQVDISNTTLPYPNPIPDTATVTYNEGLPIDSNTVYTRVIFPERGIRFI